MWNQRVGGNSKLAGLTQYHGLLWSLPPWSPWGRDRIAWTGDVTGEDHEATPHPYTVRKVLLDISLQVTSRRKVVLQLQLAAESS